MKKYPILFVALVSILILSFSVIAFAAPDSTDSAKSAKVIHGQFVAIDELQEHIEITTQTGNETLPLAKWVWVYRNQNSASITDLANQDVVELILNSKDQVAYIKAISANEQQELVQDIANGAAPDQEQPSEKQQAEDSTTDASPILGASSNSDAEDVAKAELEQIKIDIQDPNVKIKVDLMPEHPQHPATIKINTKGQASIHLSGTEAEQFIQELLGEITPKALENKELLVEKFVSLFHLNLNKLKVHILVKANGQSENYHYNDKNNKNKEYIKVEENEKKSELTVEKKDHKKKDHDNKKEKSKDKQKQKQHEHKGKGDGK